MDEPHETEEKEEPKQKPKDVPKEEPFEFESQIPSMIIESEPKQKDINTKEDKIRYASTNDNVAKKQF